jgi:steroid delta-isomerase-like uncharacterized protein
VTVTASAVVRDVFAAVAERDVGRLVARFSPRCVFEDVPAGTTAVGRTQFQAYMEDLWSSLPDFHVERCELVADATSVAAQLVLGGTHRGCFLAVEPSNRPISWRAAAFYRVDRQRRMVTRETYYYDVAELTRTLQTGNADRSLDRDPL